jgi:hypothetical protein
MEIDGSVRRRTGTVAALAFLALGAAACSGGGGGGGGGNEATQTFEMTSVAAKASNVPLTTNVTKEFVGTFHTPTVPGPLALTALTVDVNATLGSISVTKPGTRKAAPAFGFAAPSDGPLVDVTVRVSADEATVCSNGIPYGPYTVTQSGASAIVSPSDPLTADQATLSIVNTGQVAICVALLPHQDAMLSVAKAVVEATTCEVGADDIAGTWSGTYTCTNDPGCAPEGGDITLTITQSGHSAHYEAGDAAYDGTVCGGVFRFDGGGPGYTEGGTFIRRPDGSATKTSTWRDAFGGACGGSCQDSLHRVP